MKNLYDDITAQDAVELAIRASFIHKREYYSDYKYVGKRFTYKGFSMAIKEYQKKVYKTDFHVVLIKADKEHKKRYNQLDRIFIISTACRNSFMMFNINLDKKLAEVDLFQDDLFQMHKYLIENGFDIKDVRTP